MADEPCQPVSHDLDCSQSDGGMVMALRGDQAAGRHAGSVLPNTSPESLKVIRLAALHTLTLHAAMLVLLAAMCAREPPSQGW